AACSAPAGYVDNNTDCDDSNKDVNPSAAEVCNGIDDNCNDVVDEGCTEYTYYADLDGDTYGDPNNTTNSVNSTPPAGYVADNTDCDDGDAAIHPGVAEICNNIDDNSNGVADEGVKSTFYRDADGDTYGDPAV